MTCHLCGKNTSARTLWTLAIVASSTIILGQTATAQYGYPQTSALPSQPTNWWQVPAPQAYVPPSRPVNDTYAQGLTHPSDSWRLPAPQFSAPESGSVSYPITHEQAQSTSTWYVPAPRAEALPSRPANALYTQAAPQPTTAVPYATVPQTQAPAFWPAQYNYAQATAPPNNFQPNNLWNHPAPQPYGPGAYPVNYYLQDDDSVGGTGDDTPSESASPRRRRRRPSSSREIGGPFISTRTFCYWNYDLAIDGKAQVPVLGRMNVAEHNSPLPRDRAYFIYKNYSNVLNNTVFDLSGNLLGSSSRGVGQYLVGYERTFHDGTSSLELRMPFFSTGTSLFNAGFASNDPSIGNFALIGKHILYCDEQATVAAGCAVTLPTGDDSVFSLGPQTFTIQNDTAHFVPFLGSFRQSQDECWFVMAFGGLDIPTRGNQIEFVDPIAGAQDLGRLTDQTLLYLDVTVGAGCTVIPVATLLTGFALQGEVHYAGTLTAANSVQGTLAGVGWNTGYNFGNTRNRFDSTFASIVLHAELQNQTDIRVAGIFPLNDANNRFFDGELIVALTQRF